MDIGIAQDTALVLREDRGAVAWLRLNRPDNGNALSLAMLDALGAALEAAAADAAIRAVVLAASGRIFCAGHDLAEIRAHEHPAWQEALFARCSALMLRLREVGKPVIACVQGAAVAGGCQLVASCDLAYAAEAARFGVSGINIGLFCATPAVALSRVVGQRAAMELLLTGRLIEAGEAARIGLVNAAVPAEALEATVGEVAATIAGKLPEAIALGKASFYRQLEAAPGEAYRLATCTMVENLGHEATRSAIGAFLAKSQRRQE